MNQEINLPNLSVWALVEIITVEEASLLWAGIDPAFCETVENAWRNYPQEQYQQAYVTRKAIISGICTGSLPANEIWCPNPNYGQYDDEEYYLYQGKELPRISDVYPLQTTINMRALISWSEKKRIPTMKQRLEKKTHNPPTSKKQAPKHTIIPETILELPYKSKHENPPLEVLQEISKEVWDQLNKGDRPRKQFEIFDLIKEKYKERTGDEPSANLIKQIDSIARPPVFKNKKG